MRLRNGGGGGRGGEVGGFERGCGCHGRVKGKGRTAAVVARRVRGAKLPAGVVVYQRWWQGVL